MGIAYAVKKSISYKIRVALFICIISNIFLVVFGLWLVPTALNASANGISGLIGALSILLIYFGVSFFFLKPTEKFNNEILPYSLIFGISIGFVFALESILEYILLPGGNLNTKMGYTEFGLTFLIYLFAGLWSVLRTQRYFSSILTSFWCAIIASLIWFIVVLLIYYLFHGTSQQLSVLKGEGDFEDYKQSGMTDFNAFIMQDFWGAGFFHLLLGPIIATILGGVGGLFGLLFLKFFR